ncbi:TonB-dependent receptor domain-containing protein [Marilutibacter aestuarii]|uniref:Outer membrane beta-barrel protein n=1 Tax=Marilutibacter aestuarii TaxID=1706195 RepID=A0A508A3G1_9GAMM|nr:TonB-dependent receptor [Lysobacter aestuarii]TQD40392.1 outer membrane beta-barrel protein [Lysobacter aestuarii]
MTLTTARTGLFLAIAALLAPHGALAQASTAEPASSEQSPPADAGTPDQAATELDAVQVRGEFIPQPMLTSSAVMTHVSREDLSRQGDSTVADALVRVAGLSVNEGKYVYVRGLNERYSSALLNNSPLPSPEPLKRVVPLDLFPTNMLDTVEIQKTYSVRFPGEFGGGTINLTSAVVPEAPFLTLKAGIGGNSETTGQPGLTHYGGGASDFFGFDDGTRKMSTELRDALATGKRITPGPDFSSEEVKAIGRSFVNAPLNLLQTTDHVDPDYEYEISGGNAFDVGTSSRLGVIATAALKNKWRTHEGVQQDGAVEQGQMAVQSDYDFLSTTNQATVNGLLGVTLDMEDHTIGVMTMYVHDTDKETRSTEGYSLLTGDNIRDDTTRWYERELINTQLTGKHVFGEFRDLTIDWRAGHSRASLDAPYEKGFRYREDQDGNWFHDASQAQNYTRFSEVNERVDSAGVDAAWRLPTDIDFYLNFGAAWSDTERDAVQREFRFLSLGNLPFPNRYQRPDFLLSDYNISQGYITLRETTGGTGAAAYDGALETRALYVEAESQLTDNLRATAGVRYEDATQSVEPIDLFDVGQPLPTAPPLENDYFLPAVSVTWNFADNQQLRMAASKTIARPQFRELAPQQYLDLDSDRLVIGNPFLVDSELLNFDARYEWYFNRGEYLSAGVFYKNIDKPVEVVLNGRSGSSWQQSFINAPEAVVYGLELDFRKYYESPFEWTGDSRFFVSANYTYSDSEVRVDDGDVAYTLAGNGNPQPASELVMDGSRLQGQSEHLANLQLGMEDSSGSQATLLVGYASERINARGINGFDPATGNTIVVQPDYVQDPGTTVDLVLKKVFTLWNVDMELGLEARNLFNQEYSEYQEFGGGRADVMRYDLGTSYMLSLSASF